MKNLHYKVKKVYLQALNSKRFKMKDLELKENKRYNKDKCLRRKGYKTRRLLENNLYLACKSKEK